MFQPLFSPTNRHLLEMFEHIYAQKEPWRTQGVLISGLAVFEALLSEIFQSYMESKKLPWIVERPIIRHLPWQEKFDFLVEGAHIQDQSTQVKTRLKELHDLRIQYLHGKAPSLNPSVADDIYNFIPDLLQMVAELYYQLDLKPYFYQQFRDESRPLRRGSPSHILPIPQQM